MALDPGDAHGVGTFGYHRFVEVFPEITVGLKCPMLLNLRSSGYSLDQALSPGSKSLAIGAQVDGSCAAAGQNGCSKFGPGAAPSISSKGCAKPGPLVVYMDGGKLFFSTAKALSLAGPPNPRTSQREVGVSGVPPRAVGENINDSRGVEFAVMGEGHDGSVSLSFERGKGLSSTHIIELISR
jgi:hypothetical protein